MQLLLLLGAWGPPAEAAVTAALPAAGPLPAQQDWRPALPELSLPALPEFSLPEWFRPRTWLAPRDEHAAELVAELRDEVPWVDVPHARRLLTYTGGDVALARRKLRAAEEWRQGVLEPWKRAAPRQRPEARVIARGRAGRPMLYGHAGFQLPGEGAEQWALAWESALSGLPGDQQLDFIMDGHGFKPLLNTGTLRRNLKLVPALDSYFAERVANYYVLDMPPVAEWMWTRLRPRLPRKTVARVHFLRTSSAQDMARLAEACASPEQARMLAELVERNREPADEASVPARRAKSQAFTDAFLARQQSSGFGPGRYGPTEQAR